MMFLREERNLFWTVCCLLVYGCLILMAVECFSQEPKPAAHEVPSTDYVEIIRKQSADAYENSTDAIAVADEAKRIAKEANELVAKNNEALLEAGINSALKDRVIELEGIVRQDRELLDHLYNQLPQPTAIDYTQGRQLPGLTRGVVAYHVQANEYGLKELRDTIRRTPVGSYLLIDYEPWTKSTPWYGEASEAENLAWMTNYAWLIKEATPALKARRITPTLYSVPSLMPRNWTKVRRAPGDTLYEVWLKDQTRVLDNAEKSGLLPALRDAHGLVQVVGYLPDTWHVDPRAPLWLKDAIANQSRELDERGIPHRWLFRPSVNPELNRVMVEGAKGRCDWWEDRKMASEFDSIGKLLEVKQ